MRASSWTISDLSRDSVCVNSDLRWSRVTNSWSIRTQRHSYTITMKFVAAIALLASSASAFNAFASKQPAAKIVKPAFSMETIPGALAPVGVWDPLGFGAFVSC